MHVALGGPTELLGSVEVWNVAPQYRSFNLAAARTTVFPWFVALLLLFTADGDGFWNMGGRGEFTMLVQLSPIAGDSRSREGPPSGRGERIAELLAKSPCLWAGRPRVDGNIFRGKGRIALRDLAE